MNLLRNSYLLGARLARAAPAPVRRALTGAGGLAWFQLSRAQHAAALENYGVVLGLAPDHERTRRLAARAFRNYAEMLWDFTLIGNLTVEDVRERVSYDGVDRIDEALEGGRGVILSLPHMGSWDMAGAAAGVLGYDIHAVAQSFPGSLDAAVVEGRRRFGMQVIPLGRSAVPALLTVLRRNGVAALLTDVVHGSGTEVCMFGHRSWLAPGPAALSLRTGAPVLPVATWRVGPGRYHAEVAPALQPPGTGDRRADAAGLSQGVADVFERFIREHPEDWYAFRPRFQTLPEVA